MAKHICKSCGGPLDEFSPEDLKNPEFCPYCVNEKGNLKDYKDILDNMIDYIKSDHPEIKEKDRESQAVEMLREGPIWGNKFVGTIIEESLESTTILKLMTITKTEVSTDTNPQTNVGFPTWHIHSVEFHRTELNDILHFLSQHMRSGGWWCDLSFNDEVYIIFKGKVFVGSKKDLPFREKVDEYAYQIGVPKQQLPFKNIK